MKMLVQVALFTLSITSYAQSQFSNHILDYYLNDYKTKLPKEITVKMVVKNDTIAIERKGKTLRIPHINSDAILLIGIDNIQISADINADLLKNNIELKLTKFTNLHNRRKSRDGKIELKQNAFMDIEDPKKIDKIFMLTFVQKDEWNGENNFKRKEFGVARYIYK